MLSIVSQTIRKNALLQPGQAVLVAISGGPDSVALAAALRLLGYSPVLAHLNYGLRGADSDADEALVRSYAAAWQIPVFVQRVDTAALLAASPGETIQTLARKLRYDFFEKLMQEQGLTACATGHHADDQAETVLMRLLRGNSPHILQGIPVQRGAYIRPLIEVSRQDIVIFCEEQKLEWRKDKSNDKNDYLRNKLRNIVIPVIKEIQPDFSSTIANKLAWYQQQENALNQLFTQRYAQEVQTETGVSRWEPVAAPDAPMAAYVLEQWGLHGHALWAGLALLDSLPGAWIVANSGDRLARTRTGLVLYPAQNEIQPIEIQDVTDLPLHIGQWQISVATPGSKEALRASDRHYLALEAVQFPLVVRVPQAGDRMAPLGMKNGSKLLSDIMIDEHWDAARKQQALILADAAGVVALFGYRVAERVKVQSLEKEAICIAF